MVQQLASMLVPLPMKNVLKTVLYTGILLNTIILRGGSSSNRVGGSIVANFSRNSSVLSHAHAAIQ